MVIQAIGLVIRPGLLKPVLSALHLPGRVPEVMGTCSLVCCALPLFLEAGAGRTLIRSLYFLDAIRHNSRHL